MLGSLFFLIPGIIFSVWFIFGDFVLIDEDIRGVKALLRSKKYVEGRWFYVLKHLAFIFSFTFALSLLFIPVFLILNLIFIKFHPFSKFFMISGIQVLVRAFIPVFLLTYLVVLYKELKKSKNIEKLS